MNTAGAPTTSAVVRTKPIMTMPQILLMNLGFFGIQYSFGMQQTAINPIYTFLGASHDQLPLLNLAGPVTGLLIQPIIGALSDRTWVEKGFFRGRRRPFFLIGAIGCAICLALFPFVWAVWMAVLLLWLLDASNNTAMEPYRAFIADRLPPAQLGKGFLAHELAHDDAVGGVVGELEQVAQHQRDGEFDQKGRDGSGRHVFCHGSLLVFFL